LPVLIEYEVIYMNAACWMLHLAARL
jgi:hypothetical protein